MWNKTLKLKLGTVCGLFIFFFIFVYVQHLQWFWNLYSYAVNTHFLFCIFWHVFIPSKCWKSDEKDKPSLLKTSWYHSDGSSSICPLHKAGNKQSSMHRLPALKQGPCNFSRSGEGARLIIVGWPGSKF